jgi:GUN4-like.
VEQQLAYCRKNGNKAREILKYFVKKIGWTTQDGEVERKKRWFGASEFIYDVKKAPEGHLPLTSALRGTSLIKKILEHPVWENDDWKKQP